jgi:hypothetical protein
MFYAYILVAPNVNMYNIDVIQFDSSIPVMNDIVIWSKTGDDIEYTLEVYVNASDELEAKSKLETFVTELY